MLEPRLARAVEILISHNDAHKNLSSQERADLDKSVALIQSYIWSKSTSYGTSLSLEEAAKRLSNRVESTDDWDSYPFNGQG